MKKTVDQIIGMSKGILMLGKGSGHAITVDISFGKARIHIIREKDTDLSFLSKVTREWVKEQDGFISLWKQYEYEGATIVCCYQTNNTPEGSPEWTKLKALEAANK